MKICISCNIVKPFSDFSPDKRIISGVQSKCKKCYAEIMRIRRANNPQLSRDSVKKSVKKHYKKVLERNNSYRKSNPDKVKLWKQKDRKNNKHRILADNAKRRSLLNSETNIQIKQMYILRDFYKAMSLGEEFHVDHIVPLSKGGLHVFSNLQVIPAIDNLRKGSSCGVNNDH